MKKLLVLVSMLVCFHLVGAAQNQDNNSINETVVKGVLSEIVNGKKTALPFANVYIDGTTEVAMTDIDGSFEIKAVGNNCKVKCTFRGYEKFEKEIDLISVEDITLDILLMPENSAQKSEVALGNS